MWRNRLLQLQLTLQIQLYLYICVFVCPIFTMLHTHTHTMVVLHSSVWTSKTINSQTTAETRRAGNVLIGVMNNNPTAALFSSHKNTHRAFRPTNVHTHFINTTSNNKKPYRSTFKVTSKREEMKIYSGTKLPLEWKQKVENTTETKSIHNI